jgi:dolichol-phosphate mannosyltransferase
LPKLELQTRQRPQVSVVAPCYNEEQVIHEFVRRTVAACEAVAGTNFEIVLVNDGSSDTTWQLICEHAATHPAIVGVNLARNHGHQIAVTAGLAIARGERVLIIDADLQDPPELFSDMMSKMDEGFDVVYGQRKKRSGETQFKLITAKIFYRLLHRLTQVEIPADTGDFRLINRRTADLLNQMPEQQRFLRGMVAWLGGRQTPLSYDRDARYAGETKYTLRKMVRLAVDAITSFSAAPLRIATVSALIAGMIAIGLSVYALISYLFFEPVPGWTSTLIVILIFSAAQLISLGIIGEYLGRLYIQSKGRPLFMISEVVSNKSAQQEDSDELRSVG